MSDERLKNAKLFRICNPVAISPDGFIGIVIKILNRLIPKITIIHIKEIKGFQICFNGFQTEYVMNDTSVLLFNNIISKVEPYLNKGIKSIYLNLNVEDNTILEIRLYYKTRTRSRSSRSSDSDTDDIVTMPYIKESRKKQIKEFLSEFETVEKNIKKQFQ